MYVALSRNSAHDELVTSVTTYVMFYVLQVFYPGNEQPVFFVASRGHHADIGGITPGNPSPSISAVFPKNYCLIRMYVVRTYVHT